MPEALLNADGENVNGIDICDIQCMLQPHLLTMQRPHHLLRVPEASLNVASENENELEV